MNTDPRSIVDFLLKIATRKQNSELLKKFAKDLDSLCSKCQQDRIQCSITPLCSKRHLLKLRIISGAKLEDLPKFCYRQLVSQIARDKEKKRTLFRPLDSYIFLLDFLAIFFPKHYRALFKNLSFLNYEESIDVLESFQKQNKGKFRYLLKQKHLLIEFQGKLYIIFLKEHYVCCLLRKESIYDSDLLEDLIVFLSYKVPHIIVERTQKNTVLLSVIVTKSEQINLEKYFVSDIEDSSENQILFEEDSKILTRISDEILINFDDSDNLHLKLNLKLRTNQNSEFMGKEPINIADIQAIFDIFNHLLKKKEDEDE